MPKRSSKGKDANQIAYQIVATATGQTAMPVAEVAKNPAAVALGRLGGLKGGKARAAKLSSAAKKRIAKLAAIAKWKAYYSKHPKSQ